MPKLKTHVGTLTSSILDYSCHSRRLTQRMVKALSNKIQTSLRLNLFEMAARVEIESVKSQRGATAQLMSERVKRFLTFVWVWVAKVNQVTVMRQDLRRRVAEFQAITLEGLHLSGGKLLGRPLSLVLGEEGEGCGPYIVSVEWGVLHTTACTYVRTYILHK